MKVGTEEQALIIIRRGSIAEAPEREDERRKVVQGNKELELDKAQKEAMDQITRDMAALRGRNQSERKGPRIWLRKRSKLES